MVHSLLVSTIYGETCSFIFVFLSHSCKNLSSTFILLRSDFDLEFCKKCNLKVTNSVGVRYPIKKRSKSHSNSNESLSRRILNEKVISIQHALMWFHYFSHFSCSFSFSSDIFTCYCLSKPDALVNNWVEILVWSFDLAIKIVVIYILEWTYWPKQPNIEYFELIAVI